MEHVGLYECGKSLFSCDIWYEKAKQTSCDEGGGEREGNVLINGAAHGGLSCRWALVYDPGHGAMGQGQAACPTGGWMGSWRGDRFNRRLIEVWLYSALAVKLNTPHRTEFCTIVLNIWYIKDGMNRTSSVFYMHIIDIMVNNSPVQIFHKKKYLTSENVW